MNKVEVPHLREMFVAAMCKVPGLNPRSLSWGVLAPPCSLAATVFQLSLCNKKSLCFFFISLFPSMCDSYNWNTLRNIRELMPTVSSLSFVSPLEWICECILHIKNCKGCLASELKVWHCRGRWAVLLLEKERTSHTTPSHLHVERAFLWTNNNFQSYSALFLWETWQHNDITDTAVDLPGYLLIRADRQTAACGKSKGGSVCFYVNNNWCLVK